MSATPRAVVPGAQLSASGLRLRRARRRAARAADAPRACRQPRRASRPPAAPTPARATLSTPTCGQQQGWPREKEGCESACGVIG